MALYLSSPIFISLIFPLNYLLLLLYCKIIFILDQTNGMFIFLDILASIKLQNQRKSIKLLMNVVVEGNILN
jgi:hypothetical protein